MESFQACVDEYRNQLAKGAIQAAYKGLLEYMLALRTHFKNKFPEYYTSGNIYFGYMDMTYFSLSPQALKQHDLKIALVFIHETCRFEAWLAGANKQVQSKTWKRFKESGWNRYHLVPSTKGVDSIVEHILADDPDFNNLEALTQQIEGETLRFIADMESFLSTN